MASTKFEVSMEIFKFQGEPDVSVTLTGKSPTEFETALKTLETIAKTTTLYDGNSAPEAEKNVPNEPQQAAPVVSSADKFLSTPSARRATNRGKRMNCQFCISIHALREEGDRHHGAWPKAHGISIHALREEGDPSLGSYFS